AVSFVSRIHPKGQRDRAECRIARSLTLYSSIPKERLMARLSTLKQLPAIVAAAEQWKQTCFLHDGSVLSNSRLWTVSNLTSLDQHFIQNPQHGDERFLEKLHRQLDETAPPVKQLAAELLWLLFLFPRNMSGETKRRSILDVWAWSGENLDATHPLLSVLD